MSDDRLKIDELTARLSVDSKFVKDLLSEMAHQLTKQYLTVEELARRLSWEERTVRNKMETGIFQRGVHYFAPKGIRPRFKWSAVVVWLEERDRRTKEHTPADNNPPAIDAIPMAPGYLLGERRQNKLAAGS